ncbi:MAG: IS4 family transposase, partial [Bacteroidetes bacterium]
MSQISKEFNSGEPIIGQLFSHIAPEVFTKAAFITQSDVGFRKMTSKVHFICLFYAVLTKNSSIRELCKNITLVGKKLMAYGLDYLPCRSTFSDANAKRNSNYFGTFYSLLYQQHKNFLQDTQFSLPIGGEIDASKVEVFDSTTITLFKEIFKGTGRNVINGKKKGGIKAFIKMNLKEGVPNFVSYDNASQNENTFLNLLKLEPGSIAVFDKGFNKYQFFSKLTQAGIFYVTRLKDNAKYTVKEVRKVTESHLGIIKDEIIEFSFKENGIIRTAQHRLITYLEQVKNETLTFISNMMENKASTITLIYKNRWVIEVL